MFDQWGELPLLPFENPIGFVPASRGEVYIESNRRSKEMRYTVVEECGCYNVYHVDSNTPEEAKRVINEGKAIAEHHCGQNEVVEVLSEEGVPIWLKTV